MRFQKAESPKAEFPKAEFPRRFLNSLSRKFIAGVVLILLLTLAGTLFVNSRVVERFYLHEQREYLQKISEQLVKTLEYGASPMEAVRELEKTEEVFIAYSDRTDEPDILANELRENFKQKGLGFQKFWLWDRDYEAAVQNGSRFRLYSQDKMNYSILVQYLSLDSGLYALAAIVPDAQGFIKIVNRSGFLIYSISILIAMVLIFILTRHITNPLAEVREFTKNISSHRYKPLEIKTGDELEDVANSLNEMAGDIEQYQKILEEKNDQMKQLLSDVAHDLKTPVSLVGMYASGIKDGLDDGTFLDTIICQNGRMSRMIERLLHLSRIEQKEYPCRVVELDQLLRQCVEEQRIFFEQRDLGLSLDIETGVRIEGNQELLCELFSNLVSNAAKYASDGCVKVRLYREDQACIFCISNNTGNEDLDTAGIWQPFYVGETSRNKALSGTGLGLSIVKKIAEQFGYSVSCEREGQVISFTVAFLLIY